MVETTFRAVLEWLRRNVFLTAWNNCSKKFHSSWPDICTVFLGTHTLCVPKNTTHISEHLGCWTGWQYLFLQKTHSFSSTYVVALYVSVDTSYIKGPSTTGWRISEAPTTMKVFDCEPGAGSMRHTFYADIHVDNMWLKLGFPIICCHPGKMIDQQTNELEQIHRNLRMLMD